MDGRSAVGILSDDYRIISHWICEEDDAYSDNRMGV